MYELNYGYRELSFDLGDHPQVLFSDNLLKQMKETSETKKTGFVLSKKVSPSITVSVNPNNQNKSQSFLWGDRRAPRERQRYP